MLTFRVSEEEYERFHEICYSKGIRNVSEMARTAINVLLQQPDRIAEESLETRVNELEARLHRLAAEFKRLRHTSPAAATAGAIEDQAE